MASGFQNRFQQLDLIAPYFDKYFEVVNEVVEKKSREIAEVFMRSFSPVFMARE